MGFSAQLLAMSSVRAAPWQEVPLWGTDTSLLLHCSWISYFLQQAMPPCSTREFRCTGWDTSGKLPMYPAFLLTGSGWVGSVAGACFIPTHHYQHRSMYKWLLLILMKCTSPLKSIGLLSNCGTTEPNLGQLERSPFCKLCACVRAHAGAPTLSLMAEKNNFNWTSGILTQS